MLGAVVACALAALAPLNSATQTNDTPRVADAEEYAVYSAILESQFTSADVKQFVVAGDTNKMTDPSVLDRVTSDVASETISDFKGKNGKSYLLERRFDLEVPYVLARADELDALFNPGTVAFPRFMDGWRGFYGRYPGAP